jgi:hypothetical protein
MLNGPGLSQVRKVPRRIHGGAGSGTFTNLYGSSTELAVFRAASRSIRLCLTISTRMTDVSSASGGRSGIQLGCVPFGQKWKAPDLSGDSHFLRKFRARRLASFRGSDSGTALRARSTWAVVNPFQSWHFLFPEHMTDGNAPVVACLEPTSEVHLRSCICGHDIS